MIRGLFIHIPQRCQYTMYLYFRSFEVGSLNTEESLSPLTSSLVISWTRIRPWRILIPSEIASSWDKKRSRATQRFHGLVIRILHRFVMWLFVFDKCYLVMICPTPERNKPVFEYVAVVSFWKRMPPTPVLDSPVWKYFRSFHFGCANTNGQSVMYHLSFRMNQNEEL